MVDHLTQYSNIVNSSYKGLVFTYSYFLFGGEIMIISSTRLGDLEVNNEHVLQFIQPMLGFSEVKAYALVQEKNSDAWYEYLQAIDEPDLMFIIADPFQLQRDYAFDLNAVTKQQLAIIAEEDIVVRVVVSARSSEDITVNLKAPLIINLRTRQAAQIVIDRTEYSIRHLLKGGEADAHIIKD